MSSQHPFAVPTPEPRWPRWMPDIAWSPIISGVLILIAGALGYAFREPWLFASLGPTAFMVAETPALPSARFYNTVAGHLAGIISGMLAVWLVGAATAPPVAQFDYPVPARIWAAVIAVALNMLLGLLLHASHPPAAATTLLFALGVTKPNMNGALAVVAGVLIVAVFGEIARAARLGRKPGIKDILPS